MSLWKLKTDRFGLLAPIVGWALAQHGLLQQCWAKAQPTILEKWNDWYVVFEKMEVRK